MSNITECLKVLTEGVNPPKDTKKYSREEACKFFKIKPDECIFSDRIVKGKGVWINDLTSETVYAKETPKELLGKYTSKD